MTCHSSNCFTFGARETQIGWLGILQLAGLFRLRARTFQASSIEHERKGPFWI